MFSTALIQARTVSLVKARLAEAEPDMEEPSDKPVMVCIADIFKVAGTSCCLSVAICDCLDMLDFCVVVLYAIYETQHGNFYGECMSFVTLWLLFLG